MPWSVACDVLAVRGAPLFITEWELQDGALDPVTETIACMVRLTIRDPMTDTLVFQAPDHTVHARWSIATGGVFVCVKPKESPDGNR
jgi:hypothetical protein